MKKVTLIMLICLLQMAAFTQQTNNAIIPPQVFKRAFTLQPFSPITGSLKCNYNQAMPQNRTLDLGLGIIGPSTSELNLKSRGFTAKAGLKMFFAPDYYMDGLKKYSDFQGAYFEPVIAISVFSYHNWYETNDSRNASSAILLNFGKQRVVGNRFLIDTWVGAGYCFGKSEEGAPVYKFEYMEIPDIGLATTIGFSIGFLAN